LSRHGLGKSINQKMYIHIIMKISWIKLTLFFLVVSLFLLAGLIVNSDVFIDREAAKTFPGFEFQGEYTGQLDLNGDGVKQDASLQAAIYGENRIRGLFITDRLPGDTERTIRGDQMHTVRGNALGGGLMLSGAYPLRFIYDSGRFNAIDEEGNSRGYLERTVRESPTMGMRPPQDAVVLFDGSSLDHWDENTRMTDDGLLIQGARTASDYGDIHLHVEAKLGFMPNSASQGRSNSGIYIQNRYELQIIDSFGLVPHISGNGSLYNESAPRVNKSLPPLTWQTYDVYFRAPRFDEAGNKTENARITAYLNGILVQDDVELERGTGAGGQREEVAKAELYLQDHTGPVRFRNVWLVEGEVTPPGTTFLEP